MPQFTYASPAGRINKLKGEILAHAVANEVLGITGTQKGIPRNSGDTVVYRRYLPYGATNANWNTRNRPVVGDTAHELTEGVTPPADTLVPQDIQVTLKQYGCLYQLTDKTADLYEDDVPAEMKKQCGERVALLREMIRYGVVRACTNVFYAGGLSRATVNSRITRNILRNVSRTLQANHAKRITGILAPSTNIATRPIEASYLVFVHSDCEADLRDLTGFVHISEYGSRKPVHQQELGSWENFRFITSPELAPYAGVGATGTTGLLVTATRADVYPFIVVGEEAWGQVALRGVNSLDPTYIPVGQKDKSDPLGQRGYVGAKFYMNCVLLNEGWMAVVEAGASSL
jgi:N4-gp56 family major capsid protein